jgi:hypothetical protein
MKRPQQARQRWPAGLRGSLFTESAPFAGGNTGFGSDRAWLSCPITAYVPIPKPASRVSSKQCKASPSRHCGRVAENERSNPFASGFRRRIAVGQHMIESPAAVSLCRTTDPALGMGGALT